MIFIGIDPGKKTGVAVYCSIRGKILHVYTMTFWDLYYWIKNYHPNDIVVVIEDSTANTHVFHESENKATAAKIGRNVGGVHMEGQLMAEGLDRCGYKVIKQKPQDTKWTAVRVRKTTGFKGVTNEHTRDAIMVVYGR